VFTVQQRSNASSQEVTLGFFKILAMPAFSGNVTQDANELERSDLPQVTAIVGHGQKREVVLSEQVARLLYGIALGQYNELLARDHDVFKSCANVGRQGWAFRFEAGQDELGLRVYIPRPPGLSWFASHVGLIPRVSQG